jgi:hypothetical protein
MLKKISNILLLVGGIISVVSSAILITSAIVFIFLGCNAPFKEVIIQGIENGTITVTAPEGTSIIEQAELVQHIFIVLAVVLLVITIFVSISAVFSFLGAKKNTSTICIFNIVFGVLSDNIISLAGGVLGLVKETESDNEKVS